MIFKKKISFHLTFKCELHMVLIMLCSVLVYVPDVYAALLPKFNFVHYTIYLKLLTRNVVN